MGGWICGFNWNWGGGEVLVGMRVWRVFGVLNCMEGFGVFIGFEGGFGVVIRIGT